MADDDLEEYIDEVRFELDQSMVCSVWNNTNTKFLPDHCFQELLTKKTVNICLSGRASLVDFVLSDARRVFTIVLRSQSHSKWTLADALEHCREFGLVDAVLPIEKSCQACASNRKQKNGITASPCKHREELGVFRKWDRTAWSKFHEAQWAFLVPVFEDGTLEYKLKSDEILPIIEYGTGSGRGHFSDVREAYLHGSHRLGSLERGRDPLKKRRVAIKEFKSIDQGDDHGISAKQAWDDEKRNLKEISSRKHPHLVEQIAAVAIGERYFIMSAWADGGDLRHFWKSIPKPHLDDDLVLQFLVQIHGVADALQFLHRAGNDRSASSSAESAIDASSDRGLVVPSIQILGSQSSDTGGNWRHGDLKPENLLIFDRKKTRLGTIKIADLGLAKRHALVTQNRREPTSTEYGTRQYEPPEAVTHRGRPRSRLYDVWSLGCIMLEYIIWLLYGQDGLKRFWPAVGDRPHEPIFFTSSGTSAEVSEHVKKTIVQMLSDLRSDETQDSALADVLRIIRDHLLIVELPDAFQAGTTTTNRCRIKADDLERRLNKILSRARNSGGASYLTTRVTPGSAASKLPSSSSLRLGRTLQVPSPDHMPNRMRSPASQARHLEVPKSQIVS